MYVCIYLCMCTQVFIYTYACRYLCMCAPCKCVCVCVCVCVCARALQVPARPDSPTAREMYVFDDVFDDSPIDRAPGKLITIFFFDY